MSRHDPRRSPTESVAVELAPPPPTTARPVASASIMHTGSRSEHARRPVQAPAVAVGAAVVATVAIGIALRMWLLAHDPIDADQAVVGLMARSIDHGHFPVFYWGQPYGGVEPYVTAALVHVAGLHPWVVNATPALLVAIAAVLTWQLGAAVSGRLGVGAVAAALMWVWSEVDLWNSTREYGFRGVVLVCSIAVLLATVRILRDDRRVRTWILLGASAALGWWASPEILYVAIPCLVAVVWTGTRDVRRRGVRALAPVATGTVVCGIVLVPWMVATVHDHFASIREATADQGADHLGYLGRLQVFFVHTLPMVLGARLPITGAWLGGRPVGAGILTATVVLLAIGVVTAAARLPAARVVVAVVVLYPFVEAAMGPTFYWQDARYGMYLPPVILVAAVAGWNSLLGDRGESNRTHLGRRAGVAVLACALASASTVAGLLAATTVPGVTGPTGFAAAPLVLIGHPDAIGRSITTALVDQHVTHLYADYWVAYDLDLLAPGRIDVTPPDIVRSPSLAASVRRSPHPAWLFVGPTAADIADCAVQFQNPLPEPLGLHEGAFTAMLAANHISYRSVDAGPMIAVIPSSAITPQWVLAHLHR